MKPVLLLDIDGVINAVSKALPAHVWPTLAWDRAEYAFNGEQLPLLWSKPVVEYLTELDLRERVEIRWHTTWQATASEFGALVGLPEFPIAQAGEYMANPSLFAKQQLLAGKPNWWKYPAAERVLTEEERPLIWVDDDITWKVPRVYRDAMAKLGTVLIVSPDKVTGLIPRHLRRIEEFLLGLEKPYGAATAS